MAEKIEGVYEIKIVQGPALRAFEDIKKRLDNTKVAIRDMNKETRALVAEEQAISKAIAQTGQATAEQTAALARNKAQREGLNKTLSEAVLTERALSAQARELSNDLAGLTDHGLRFRDKMAEATTIALQQSGIIGELGKRHEQLSGAMERVDAAMAGNAAQTQALNAALANGEVTQKQYADEQARLASELIDAKAAQKLLSDEMAKNNAITTQLDQKVGELNKELAAGKITTKQYGESLKAIEAEARKASEGVGQLGSKFDQFVSGQGQQLRSTLGSMALQYIGVQAAINGVVNVIGGAITTIKEFDVQLAKVSALGGEYAEQINALGDAAKSLGPKFGVGPKKALESVEALAKAGVSASDILGGALEGALSLSASGALAAGDAAEYAASTMVQFGLAGKDMTHVADLMSAAANKAMGEVSDFGDALKFIGPVAAGAGVSLEETTGTLALFAQNGILGQQAGTGLRGVLSSLTSPSAQATKQMEQLGIITADGSNKLYDAQGNFLGLANMAGVLSEATAGLTQQQRDQALGQIFGNQQITAANILLKGGKDAVNEWTDAVNDSGIAQRIANEQLNTVAGSLDKLSASWDAAVVSIDKGDGPISRAIKNMADGLASLINFAVDARGEVERLLIADLDAAKARGELTNEQYESQVATTKAITQAKRAQDEINEVLKERNLHSSDYNKLLEKNNEQLLRSIGYSKTQEQTEEGLRYVRETLNDEMEAAAPLFAKAEDGSQRLTYAQKVEVEARKAGIAILEAEVERREKAINATKAQAEAQAAAANAAKEAKDTKATSATATVGERTAYLKEQLEAAKAARENLTATDKEGIATADKSIASIQRQIDALNGTAKAAKTSSDAAKERQQVLDDIAKAERERERRDFTPEELEVAKAGDDKEARVQQAQGDAQLLLKIEAEYQAQVTEIQTRYAAERFAARQEAEDAAQRWLAGKREEATRNELSALEQAQQAEMDAAVRNGDDLAALMQQQAEARAALVAELREADVQRINEEFEAQYAVLDEQQIAELGLVEQHQQALNDLKEQYRQEDEANAAASAQRTMAALEQAHSVELGMMQDVGQLMGEAMSGQLQDQKDFHKAFLQMMLKAFKAQLQMEIAKASAASLASPDSVATFGLSGLARAAVLTGLLEGLFAGLSGIVSGFAGGGTVPDGRGTVRPGWGTPVRRSNGDNVMVTLRTGEKVLNQEQQRRLEAITSGGIWGAIGLPGHGGGGNAVLRAFRHGISAAGYAQGGTIGIVTPRPSPQTVVQNQFVGAMNDMGDRPIFVSVKEINDVQGRVTVTETLGTL